MFSSLSCQPTCARFSIRWVLLKFGPAVYADMNTWQHKAGTDSTNTHVHTVNLFIITEFAVVCGWCRHLEKSCSDGNFNIHSFIHSGDLYSASSRGAPSPVTDKKEGLQRDVKFGRVGHQQGTQLKGEIIPCRWSHNRKSPSLHNSQTGPRDQKLTLRSRTQRPTCGQNRHWAAEVAEVRGGAAKDTTGDHCSDTILYPLKYRQPVEYITYVGSDGRKLGQPRCPPTRRAAERRTRSSRPKVPRGSPASREQQQSIRLVTNAWTSKIMPEDISGLEHIVRNRPASAWRASSLNEGKSVGKGIHERKDMSHSHNHLQLHRPEAM